MDCQHQALHNLAESGHLFCHDQNPLSKGCLPSTPFCSQQGGFDAFQTQLVEASTGHCHLFHVGPTLEKIEWHDQRLLNFGRLPLAAECHGARHGRRADVLHQRDLQLSRVKAANLATVRMES